MPLRRHPTSWTLAFAGLMLLAAGVAAGGGPPAKSYRGTLYYADHHGIWKVSLPSLDKTRLASQELHDPAGLTLSPDEDWLAYYEMAHTETGRTSPLWVLSTQGGTPVQVVADTRGSTFLPPHQLLYQEEGQLTPFLFDPSTEERQLAERWRGAFTSCLERFNATGRAEFLQSCIPDEPLRGFLRLVDLDGSQIITITEPYFSDYFVWSPDGERVLFRDGSGDYKKLYVWSRRDGTLRQVMGEVSHQGLDFEGLTWSPDGRWATFGSSYDWYAVELATGSVVRFGPVQPLGGYPEVWSPDSRAVLTVLTLPGQTEALWKGTPTAAEFRFAIVGIPEGHIVTLLTGEDLPCTAVWGRK